MSLLSQAAADEDGDTILDFARKLLEGGAA